MSTAKTPRRFLQSPDVKKQDFVGYFMSMDGYIKFIAFSDGLPTQERISKLTKLNTAFQNLSSQLSSSTSAETPESERNIRLCNTFSENITKFIQSVSASNRSDQKKSECFFILERLKQLFPGYPCTFDNFKFFQFQADSKVRIEASYYGLEKPIIFAPNGDVIVPIYQEIGVGQTITYLGSIRYNAATQVELYSNNLVAELVGGSKKLESVTESEIAAALQQEPKNEDDWAMLASLAALKKDPWKTGFNLFLMGTVGLGSLILFSFIVGLLTSFVIGAYFAVPIVPPLEVLTNFAHSFLPWVFVATLEITLIAGTVLYANLTPPEKKDLMSVPDAGAPRAFENPVSASENNSSMNPSLFKTANDDWHAGKTVTFTAEQRANVCPAPSFVAHSKKTS